MFELALFALLKGGPKLNVIVADHFDRAGDVIAVGAARDVERL